MTIDLISFFKPGRLFDLQPGNLSHGMLIFLSVVFSILVVAGVAVKIYRQLAKKDNCTNKLLNKYFGLLLTMGILGLVWVWFRDERVNFLSARFWLVIWLAGLIIWLAMIIKFQTKTIPEIRRNIEKKKELARYLPKKKTRSM